MSVLVLWLWIMKCLCCLFVVDLNFKVCGVVQSLVLNYLFCCHCVSCLCFSDVLLGCCALVKVIIRHFPLLSQFTQKSLTTPEPRHCLFVHECLVFASPLVVLCVKPLSAFFNLPLCLCGLCLSVLSEGGLECLPIVQMQFVFLLFGGCFDVSAECYHALMFLLESACFSLCALTFCFVPQHF